MYFLSGMVIILWICLFDVLAEYALKLQFVKNAATGSMIKTITKA